MNRLTRRLTRRHEPGGIRKQQLKAGVGAAVAIVVLGLLAHLTGRPLLLAPFGASSVLLFGQARSPLAQPVNMLGGYLVACLCSMVLLGLFPASLVAAGIAVGVSISIMLILRVSHPPAGAIPVVALMSQMGMGELFVAVMGGAGILLVVAFVHHLLPPRQPYPLDIDLG